MAITYSIAPNPHWVIIDNFSKLPPGAAIYTYSSLPPNAEKPAFQDPAGMIPFSNPIVGFGNGTMPPIYWEFDSSNPTDLYYIRVYDSSDKLTQNFLWDFNGISGAGGGGGGTVTETLDIENLVINGEFYRNCGNLTPVPALVTLAPSNNSGFVNDTSNTNVTNFGPVSPDIIFAKSNTSATDSLTFNEVNPVGQNFPGPLAINPMPIIYVNYTTSVSGTESYKYIQFPICKGLQNLSNITASFQLFARYNSQNINISLAIRQFFGSGNNGPSADVITNLGPLTLSPGVWTASQYTSIVIPSIAGKTIGNCGNDALYLQIVFPLTALINIDFILPSMYLGTSISTIDFHTLDFVDAIVNSPRTGDIRTSLNSFLLGWVAMNDGTIGNSSSNATSLATNDTFALFDLIWQTFKTNQTLAPMYNSAGTPISYGASSAADYSANNQISLTQNAGRIMAGALPVAASQTFVRAANTLVVSSTAGFYTGMAVTVNVSGGNLFSGVIYYAIVESLTTLSLATTTANALANTVIPLGAVPNGTIVSVNVETIGSYIGEESHAQSITELASHNHSYSIVIAGGTFLQGGPGGQLNTVNTGNTGGGVPFNIMQPTVYMNIFIKL